MPAVDELELCYRAFKPTTGANYTNNITRNDTGSAPNGTNPNSDPTGSAYTTSVPGQTSVVVFRSGGAESFSSSNYY
jgi:hypothetical protein